MDIWIDIYIFIYPQDPPCDQVLRALHSWCRLCFPSAEGIVLGVRSHHNLNAQCIEASHDCGWERNQLTNKNIDIYIYIYMYRAKDMYVKLVWPA